MSTTVASILSVISNETASPSLSYVPTTPEWMVEFIAFRQRLFLKIVEPIIVMILPYEDDIIGDSKSLEDSATEFSGENYEHRNETMHRRLGFLPDYVENASSVRETSMSFSTLITLFVTMSCILRRNQFVVWFLDPTNKSIFWPLFTRYFSRSIIIVQCNSKSN